MPTFISNGIKKNSFFWNNNIFSDLEIQHIFIFSDGTEILIFFSIRVQKCNLANSMDK